MNKLLTLLILLALTIESYSFAQVKPNDSVIIHVGDSSKIVVSIRNQKDLETVKQYDFQALMNDLISRLEKKDTLPSGKPSASFLKDTTRSQTAVSSPERTVNDNDWENERNHHRNRRTYHSFNIDLGTNNYLSNGKFPDQTNAQYTVKPWGSWYIALNSIQRTHVGGKLFLEWGMGVSWYNFKFQDTHTLVSKTSGGTTFDVDPRAFDFIKSKLTATYLNASLVPVIDFGRGDRKTMIFDGSRVDFSARGNHSSGFRLGVGPYAGYRIGSYSKQVYKDNGQTRQDYHSENFYLNNIRYGIRVQLGFNDIDFFFNYDLNNLFVDTKGPKLNAISFGVTF